MSESVLRRRADGTYYQMSSRYTKREIQRAWYEAGNKALEKSKSVIEISNVTEDSAYELSALFVRRVHPNLHCVHYEKSRQRFRMFLGDCDDVNASMAYTKNMVRAYEIAGADEGGRLFAEDGDFEVNVPELVRVLLDASEVIEDMDLKQRIAHVLRRDYLGIT